MNISGMPAIVSEHKCWVCSRTVLSITSRGWEGRTVCHSCLPAAPVIKILRDRIEGLSAQCRKQRDILGEGVVVASRPPTKIGGATAVYNEAIDDAIEEILNPDWRDNHDTNLRIAETVRDLKR